MSSNDSDFQKLESMTVDKSIESSAASRTFSSDAQELADGAKSALNDAGKYLSDRLSTPASATDDKETAAQRFGPL